jgi:hypothetical protein
MFCGLQFGKTSFVTTVQLLFDIHSGTDPQAMKTKDATCVPPLPNVRDCIITTVISTNRDMLVRVWTGLEYWIDVCHATCGSNMEDL